MILLELCFSIGLILAVFGVFKRNSRSAKWMVVSGLVIMTLMFIIGEYAEIKSGFMDALAD